MTAQMPRRQTNCPPRAMVLPARLVSILHSLGSGSTPRSPPSGWRRIRRVAVAGVGASATLLLFLAVVVAWLVPSAVDPTRCRCCALSAFLPRLHLLYMVGCLQDSRRQPRGRGLQPQGRWWGQMDSHGSRGPGHSLPRVACCARVFHLWRCHALGLVSGGIWGCDGGWRICWRFWGVTADHSDADPTWWPCCCFWGVTCLACMCIQACPQPVLNVTPCSSSECPESPTILGVYLVGNNGEDGTCSSIFYFREAILAANTLHGVSL